MATTEIMGLAEAAQKLRMPYQDCHRLLLIGALRGEKRKGRWYVETSDVEALAGSQEATGPTSVTAG